MHETCFRAGISRHECSQKIPRCVCRCGSFFVAAINSLYFQSICLVICRRRRTCMCRRQRSIASRNSCNFLSNCMRFQRVVVRMHRPIPAEFLVPASESSTGTCARVIEKQVPHHIQVTFSIALALDHGTQCVWIYQPRGRRGQVRSAQENVMEPE